MLKLKLYDTNNKVIFKGKTSKLKVPDKLIIEKSIEWFRDPEPCFIHRGAVMKRLFVELEDELETCGERWVEKDELSENACNILADYQALQAVEI